MSLKLHQIEHARCLMAAWASYGVYLDASDTGSGKSYVAAYICRVVNVRPVIICPLSAVSQWFAIMAEFGVTPIAVSNYEQIKEGRAREIADGPSVNVPWIQTDTNKWNLPRDSAIIFDECHRGKNHDTGISNLLMSLRAAIIIGVRVALLSATAADTIDAFRPVGVVLGISQKDPAAFKNWVKRRPQPHADIAAMLYGSDPPRASKMILPILRDQIVESLALELPADVSATAAALVKKLEGAAAKTLLGEIQQCRQEIEILKAPFVAKKAYDAFKSGYRPVVFTNFERAREIIYSILVEKIYTETGAPPVQLYGKQKMSEREHAIEMFRSDAAPAIVVSISVGGSAISLHSVNPNHPRALFIMPGWSGIDVTQALGRCAREGAADVPRAWIIYTDCPLEKHICELMNNKLKLIAQLNQKE